MKNDGNGNYGANSRVLLLLKIKPLLYKMRKKNFISHPFITIYKKLIERCLNLYIKYISGSPCRWKILRKTREYIVSLKLFIHPEENNMWLLRFNITASGVSSSMRAHYY